MDPVLPFSHDLIHELAQHRPPAGLKTGDEAMVLTILAIENAEPITRMQVIEPTDSQSVACRQHPNDYEIRLATSSCEKQNSACGSELKGTRRDHEHNPSYGTLPLLRQADAASRGETKPRSAPSAHGRDPGNLASHLGASGGLVAAIRKWHLYGLRRRSPAGSAERTRPSAKASRSVLRPYAWTRRRSLDPAVTPTTR